MLATTACQNPSLISSDSAELIYFTGWISGLGRNRSSPIIETCFRRSPDVRMVDGSICDRPWFWSFLVISTLLLGLFGRHGVTIELLNYILIYKCPVSIVWQVIYAWVFCLILIRSPSSVICLSFRGQGLIFEWLWFFAPLKWSLGLFCRMISDKRYQEAPVREPWLAIVHFPWIVWPISILSIDWEIRLFEGRLWSL